MKINAIYTTFMGEQNPFGIGAPVHFLRTQGCHLRCYLPTLGVLCDTPEGLTREGGTEMSAPQIITVLDRLRENSGGVSLVCLSGGDPLWRSEDSLNELFGALFANGFKVVVETSGTLSMRAYRQWSNVDWVLDFKTLSAGVKKADNMLNDVPVLTNRDIVKFVLHDEADYHDFVNKLDRLVALNSVAKIVVGVFWGEFAKREPKANLSAMRQLMGWLAEGKIKPRISARYALAETAKALNDMAARKVTGKVVILPGK